MALRSLFWVWGCRCVPPHLAPSISVQWCQAELRPLLLYPCAHCGAFSKCLLLGFPNRPKMKEPVLEQELETGSTVKNADCSFWRLEINSQHLDPSAAPTPGDPTPPSGTHRATAVTGTDPHRANIKNKIFFNLEQKQILWKHEVEQRCGLSDAGLDTATSMSSSDKRSTHLGQVSI